MARQYRKRRRNCERCKTLQNKLRIALGNWRAMVNRVENAEQKQRRAESVLVGYKTLVLEAIRR